MNDQTPPSKPSDTEQPSGEGLDGTPFPAPLEGFTEKTDDERWRDHFVLPIAFEMKRRQIREMRIQLTENNTAVFELLPKLPENFESTHRHQRRRASRWEMEFIARVMLKTRRLVAVAVSRLLGGSRTG
jgi:hypothetical protein